MSQTAAEDAVLDRFREKSRSAGKPRAGFVLRRESLLYVQPDHPALDLEQGIAGLIDKKILSASESGNFLFLTETGAERLNAP